MIWQITVIFAILALLNALLWIFAMPWYVNRRISRFQNDLVNRHYDEVETMYRKMRGWRHDYHNHIQTLKAHMDMAQYEQASLYLERLEEDLRTVDTVLKTGNVMVDAILNSKLTLIQERHIQTDATALVPEDIPISGIDLSVLIGNLLDNAMEACLKVPRERRFIRLYIARAKENLYIYVMNAADGSYRRQGGRYLSTKPSDSHGFGLQRIDKVIKKYQGYRTREDEGDVFATEILIPL